MTKQSSLSGGMFAFGFWTADQRLSHQIVGRMEMKVDPGTHRSTGQQPPGEAASLLIIITLFWKSVLGKEVHVFGNSH